MFSLVHALHWECAPSNSESFRCFDVCVYYVAPSWLSRSNVFATWAELNSKIKCVGYVLFAFVHAYTTFATENSWVLLAKCTAHGTAGTIELKIVFNFDLNIYALSLAPPFPFSSRFGQTAQIAKRARHARKHETHTRRKVMRKERVWSYANKF